MYCRKCGNAVADDASFCANCGEKIESSQVNVNNDGSNNNFNNYDSNNGDSKKEKSSNASLIIGIISLVLSFIFTVLILPLAIVGLVLGLSKKAKNKVGVILNAIAIVVSIIVFVTTINSPEFKEFLSKFYNELSYSSSDNFVAGNYNCTGVDSDTSEYLITLHLNKNKTFLYGPYGKLDNNYAKGTYTFEDEEKTDASGDYKYFMLTLTGSKDDFIIEGSPADHDFNSQMEFGITSVNVKKQGVIMFVSNYNMYYCYEE